MGRDSTVSKQSEQIVKAISIESFVFLIIVSTMFFLIGRTMGGINMINTMMRTAYDLLINTAFYIMAIAVLAGAFQELLQEFGVISLANRLLSPFIRPLFGMPGACVIGVFTTYLSDNPAILPFGRNVSIRKYFKKYQLPALTNIGTAFGMGLIVSAFIAGLKKPDGGTYVSAVFIGNFGAIIGAIVSTRLMLYFSSRAFGKDADPDTTDCLHKEEFDIMNFRKIRKGGVASRLMSAALDGGKSGVDLGIAIIPGVLLITTLVLMLTNGASVSGEYTGSAYEGVGFLTYLGSKIDFILKPLFGFKNPEAMAVPLTALGAAGAAIGLIPNLINQGLVDTHDIAVFTAMCMCFSGYLCTHLVMMETLKFRELTGKAIFSHTMGGIVAGTVSHLLYSFLF